MKHYNRIKNLILAGMAGFIYYKYIVPSIPILDKLFALAFVCAMVFDIMETLDVEKKVKVRERRYEKECAGSLGENHNALRN